HTADPATGFPLPALAVLGYLELTDESTLQANKLGLMLALAATTIAKYTITETIGTTSGTREAAGFMKDGTGSNPVNFDFVESYANVTGGSTGTEAYDLSAGDGTAI